MNSLGTTFSHGNTDVYSIRLGLRVLLNSGMIRGGGRPGREPRGRGQRGGGVIPVAQRGWVAARGMVTLQKGVRGARGNRGTRGGRIVRGGRGRGARGGVSPGATRYRGGFGAGGTQREYNGGKGAQRMPVARDRRGRGGWSSHTLKHDFPSPQVPPKKVQTLRRTLSTPSATASHLTRIAGKVLSFLKRSNTEGSEGGGADPLYPSDGSESDKESDVASDFGENQIQHDSRASAAESLRADDLTGTVGSPQHAVFARHASEYELEAAEIFHKLRTDKSRNKTGSQTVEEKEAATRERVQIDRFGFLVGGDRSNRTMHVPSTWEIRLENSRLQKWRSMLDKGLEHTSEALLKKRVRKGIPMPLRATVWSHLLGANALMAMRPSLYEELQHEEDAPYEDAILKDVYRSFPDNILFEKTGGYGQKKLFHVLRAISVYDCSLGYCQGMAFLVGFFLIFMSEECVFWCMLACMKGHKWRLRGLYLEGMPRTMVVLFTLDKLMALHIPKLSVHFKLENVATHMFATKWIMTIFTQDFPFELCLWMWDIFVNEGWKIVYRVMLALLKLAEKELLGKTFEDILIHLNNLPMKLIGKHETIIQFAVNKIKITTKEVDRLEREAERVVVE